MSPTPVSMASPLRPASYSWEATNESVAARYGVPIERIARFDLTNSDAVRYLQERLAGFGVEDALERAGAKAGDEVRIGAEAFEFIPEHDAQAAASGGEPGVHEQSSAPTSED